jgi:uncharacterized protein
MKSLEEIRAILRSHQDEWKRRYGVHQMAIFGSYSRGDATESSDIDVLVDIDPAIGLLFVEFAEELEKTLEAHVDLVSRRAVRPAALRYIEKDLVSV